jgi:hypothetical protein
MELAWGERDIPVLLATSSTNIRSQLGRLNSLQLRDWILELTTEYPDSVCSYHAMMLGLIVHRIDDLTLILSPIP